MLRAARQPLLPDDEAARLAERLRFEIPSQICAPLGGAAGAVRALRDRGYRLVTASGADSAHPRGTLSGSGLIGCFHAVTGPIRLAARRKARSSVAGWFRPLGAKPIESVVVDHFGLAIKWAAEAGARTIHVARDRESIPQADTHISSISALPQAVNRLTLTRGEAAHESRRTGG